MTRTFPVGDWTFSPDEGELIRGDQRRRLELRASRVLTLLCQANGAIVSHDQLVADAWDGRQIHRNGVAVVIADLRRALDDDARAPKIIATAQKRGYRLLSVPTQAPAQRATSRLILSAMAAVVAVVAIGVAIAVLGPQPAHRTLPLYVDTFANQTNNPVNDALALSVRDLVTTEAAQLKQVRVLTGPSEATSARMHGALIMWDGDVALSLFVSDVSTGEVIWSGMASGPSAQLPRQVHDELRRLDRELRIRTPASTSSFTG